MKEFWKDIKGYEGLYQISNFGKVKSLSRYCSPKDFLLKLNDDGKGYFNVCLSKENKRKTYLIHQLVAQAFISNPRNLSQINHKDTNPKNNRVDNLEWCTSQENMTHAKNNNLMGNQKGSNNPRAKLTEYDVIKIKQFINQNYKIDFIVRRYNVSKNTIYDIKKGRRWSHVCGST